MSDDTTPPSDQSGGGTPPPPPPPPPPPAYQAPPSNSDGYDAVEAIKYGWAKFTKNPGQLLVPGLVFLLSVIVVEVVVQIVVQSVLLGTHDCTTTLFGATVNSKCGPGFFMSLFANSIGSFAASLLISALGAGMIKCALNLVDGREVVVGDVFGYVAKPNVFATAALIAVATFVGTLLCVLPGIIVSFLTTFAMFYVVDKGKSPTDAIRASISLMTSRLGDMIIFFLLGIACIIVGVIACGIGIFVAAPVVAIAAAFTFRTLNGEPVSPVEA